MTLMTGPGSTREQKQIMMHRSAAALIGLPFFDKESIVLAFLDSFLFTSGLVEDRQSPRVQYCHFHPLAPQYGEI